MTGAEIESSTCGVKEYTAGHLNTTSREPLTDTFPESSESEGEKRITKKNRKHTSSQRPSAIDNKSNKIPCVKGENETNEKEKTDENTVKAARKRRREKSRKGKNCKITSKGKAVSKEEKEKPRKWYRGGRYVYKNGVVLRLEPTLGKEGETIYVVDPTWDIERGRALADKLHGNAHMTTNGDKDPLLKVNDEGDAKADSSKQMHSITDGNMKIRKKGKQKKKKEKKNEMVPANDEWSVAIGNNTQEQSTAPRRKKKKKKQKSKENATIEEEDKDLTSITTKKEKKKKKKKREEVRGKENGINEKNNSNEVVCQYQQGITTERKKTNIKRIKRKRIRGGKVQPLPQPTSNVEVPEKREEYERENVKIKTKGKKSAFRKYRVVYPFTFPSSSDEEVEVERPKRKKKKKRSDRRVSVKENPIEVESERDEDSSASTFVDRDWGIEKYLTMPRSKHQDLSWLNENEDEVIWVPNDLKTTMTLRKYKRLYIERQKLLKKIDGSMERYKACLESWKAHIRDFDIGKEARELVDRVSTTMAKEQAQEVWWDEYHQRGEKPPKFKLVYQDDELEVFQRDYDNYPLGPDEPQPTEEDLAIFPLRKYRQVERHEEVFDDLPPVPIRRTQVLLFDWNVGWKNWKKFIRLEWRNALTNEPCSPPPNRKSRFWEKCIKGQSSSDESSGDSTESTESDEGTETESLESSESDAEEAKKHKREKPRIVINCSAGLRHCIKIVKPPKYESSSDTDFSSGEGGSDSDGKTSNGNEKDPKPSKLNKKELKKIQKQEKYQQKMKVKEIKKLQKLKEKQKKEKRKERKKRRKEREHEKKKLKKEKEKDKKRRLKEKKKEKTKIKKEKKKQEKLASKAEKKMSKRTAKIQKKLQRQEKRKLKQLEKDLKEQERYERKAQKKANRKEQKPSRKEAKIKERNSNSKISVARELAKMSKEQRKHNLRQSDLRKDKNTNHKLEIANEGTDKDLKDFPRSDSKSTMDWGTSKQSLSKKLDKQALKLKKADEKAQKKQLEREKKEKRKLEKRQKVTEDKKIKLAEKEAKAQLKQQKMLEKIKIKEEKRRAKEEHKRSRKAAAMAAKVDMNDKMSLCREKDVEDKELQFSDSTIDCRTKQDDLFDRNEEEVIKKKQDKELKRQRKREEKQTKKLLKEEESKQKKMKKIQINEEKEKEKLKRKEQKKQMKLMKMGENVEKERQRAFKKEEKKKASQLKKISKKTEKKMKGKEKIDQKELHKLERKHKDINQAHQGNSEHKPMIDNKTGYQRVENITDDGSSKRTTTGDKKEETEIVSKEREEQIQTQESDGYFKKQTEAEKCNISVGDRKQKRKRVKKSSHVKKSHKEGDINESIQPEAKQKKRKRSVANKVSLLPTNDNDHVSANDTPDSSNGRVKANKRKKTRKSKQKQQQYEENLGQLHNEIETPGLPAAEESKKKKAKRRGKSTHTVENDESDSILDGNNIAPTTDVESKQKKKKKFGKTSFPLKKDSSKRSSGKRTSGDDVTSIHGYVTSSHDITPDIEKNAIKKTKKKISLPWKSRGKSTEVANGVSCDSSDDGNNRVPDSHLESKQKKKKKHGKISLHRKKKASKKSLEKGTSGEDVVSINGYVTSSNDISPDLSKNTIKEKNNKLSSSRKSSPSLRESPNTSQTLMSKTYIQEREDFGRLQEDRRMSALAKDDKSHCHLKSRKAQVKGKAKRKLSWPWKRSKSVGGEEHETEICKKSSSTKRFFWPWQKKGRNDKNSNRKVNVPRTADTESDQTYSVVEKDVMENQSNTSCGIEGSSAAFQPDGLHRPKSVPQKKKWFSFSFKNLFRKGSKKKPSSKPDSTTCNTENIPRSISSILVEKHGHRSDIENSSSINIFSRASQEQIEKDAESDYVVNSFTNLDAARRDEATFFQEKSRTLSQRTHCYSPDRKNRRKSTSLKKDDSEKQEEEEQEWVIEDIEL